MKTGLIPEGKFGYVFFNFSCYIQTNVAVIRVMPTLMWANIFTCFTSVAFRCAYVMQEHK